MAVGKDEDEEDQRFHDFSFGNIGNSKLYSVLKINNLSPIEILKKEGRFRNESWFFMIGYEDVVVNFFVKIKVCQSLLILRFLFNHLFDLFNVQFANSIEIFYNFCYYDLGSFGKGFCFDRMTKTQSDSHW